MSETIKVEVELECKICGQPLSTLLRGNGETIMVYPCESCLEDARDEGLAAGKSGE